MFKKNFKKFISLMLALAMTITLLPSSVYQVNAANSGISSISYAGARELAEKEVENYAVFLQNLVFAHKILKCGQNFFM